MLLSIEIGANKRLITKILATLLPDHKSILDLTYSKGNFWYDKERQNVTSNDIDSNCCVDYWLDFTKPMPFANESFDVVVFDPPYQTDVSKSRESVMGARFGHYKNIAELKYHVEEGTKQAWRLAKVGIIVKVQDYIHGSKRVRMTKWVEDAVGQEPYDIVFLMKQSMIEDPSWKNQLSVRSNHTTFLIFRKGSQRHTIRS